MRKRFKLRKGRSKKMFSRTANRTNKRNLRPTPMRGGFRL